MSILGVNAYAHDSGVAIVQDGVLVQAHEEERFDRTRKTSAFPIASIEYLRSSLDLRLRDVAGVGFPWVPHRIAKMVARLVLGQFPPAYRLLTTRASPRMNVSAAVRFLRVGHAIEQVFGAKLSSRVTFVPHHLAHACNAYFLSPFDESAVLVMDGFGDECSTSTFFARGGSLELLRKNDPLNSLGVLYSVVTKHLGYDTVNGEGTVMALSSHGSEDMRDRFRSVVSLRPDGSYKLDDRYFSYRRYGELKPVSDLFVETFGPARSPGEPIRDRHRSLARALQCAVEDAVLHAVRDLRKRTDARYLCVSGGVALNCLVNGRVAREGGFDQVYIPPNPNDAGQALGAALAISCLGAKRRHPDPEGRVPFVGASYAASEAKAELGARGIPWRQVGNIAEVVATQIARGRVVAWFQGSAEMGPRALGNRSILADPRSASVGERLCAIKGRESFRPFAPSVLAERVSEFFEDVCESLFMSFAFRVKSSMSHLIPAVVACDGTARIQTVPVSDTWPFRRLIEAFERRTGIPMLLNTSFNVDGPIVGTPSEALRTFLESSIDLLVLGDLLIEHPKLGEERGLGPRVGSVHDR